MQGTGLGVAECGDVRMAFWYFSQARSPPEAVGFTCSMFQGPFISVCSLEGRVLALQDSGHLKDLEPRMPVTRLDYGLCEQKGVFFFS